MAQEEGKYSRYGVERKADQKWKYVSEICSGIKGGGGGGMERVSLAQTGIQQYKSRELVLELGARSSL